MKFLFPRGNTGKEKIFTPLKKKLLEENSRALHCAADAFFHMENDDKTDFCAERLLFSESTVSYIELCNTFTMYLKMKKMRLYSVNTPCMHRFRSFHIRSLEEFRTWIRIERYDSDLLYDETDEAGHKKMIFYPSSAELAANGLIRLGKSCSYVLKRLERKVKKNFIS